MKYKATIFIITLCLVTFLLPNTLRYGLFVIGGQPTAVWRIVTYGFTHIDLSHLISNMLYGGIALLVYERYNTSNQTLGIFLLASIIGGIVFAYTVKFGFVVGASCGIYGIVGALLVSKHTPLHWRIIMLLPIIFIGGDGVYVLGHIIGLIVGILSTLFLKEKRNNEYKKSEALFCSIQ